MKMTPNEIRREFEAAKDRRNQIQVLADLNVCDPADIVHALISAGVDRRLLPNPYRSQALAETQKRPAQIIKPRALHDWDRIAELAEAVRDAVAEGKPPEDAWIYEMSDTLIRYYPSSTKEGEPRK